MILLPCRRNMRAVLSELSQSLNTSAPELTFPSLAYNPRPLLPLLVFFWNNHERWNRTIKAIRVDTPLIDVRAPIEFARGAMPAALNLPLMNDDDAPPSAPAINAIRAPRPLFSARPQSGQRRDA